MSRPAQERGTLFRATVRQLGASVRTMRLDRGWTLEAAADRMGLDARHLQRIESSEVNVTLLTLTKIAAGFNTRPAWLLDNQPRALATEQSAAESTEAERLDRESEDHSAVPESRRIELLLRTVGLRLAEARREKRLTQAELAAILRVPLEKLRRIEIGRAMTVPLKLIARVALVLQVPPTSLFGVLENPVPRRGRPSVVRRQSE